MSDTATIKFDDREVRMSMKRLARRLPDAIGAGVEAAGFEVIGEAKKLAPVDTGNLMSSAYVSPPHGSVLAGGVAVEIGFGAEYAPYVHETTEEKLRGQPRPAPRKGSFWDGGESKFLEKAMDRKLDDAAERMAEAIWDGIRGFPSSGRPSDIPESPSDS